MMISERARPLRPSDRFRALRALLDAALRRTQADGPDHVDPSERLTSGLAACRLEIAVEGVELSASVTQDLRLNVDVRTRQGWTEAHERALRRAVEASGSPLASLILVEWHHFHSAFRAMSRSTTRFLEDA
jgi:hypothetical protein